MLLKEDCVTYYNIDEIRLAAIEEGKRRKSLPHDFVQCERCRGYFGKHFLDSEEHCLCEKCQLEVHIISFENK